MRYYLQDVGYSSNRMTNIMGRFTFNNKPIKIVMVEYYKNNINENPDEDDANANEVSIIDNDDDEAE